MKNTIVVEPRGAVQLANNENAKIGESVYVKNLRERDGAFEAVGEFEPFCQLAEGENLLLVHEVGADTHVLTHSGGEVYWHSVLSDGVETLRRKHIVTTEGNIVKALKHGQLVVIWTTVRPVYLRYGASGYEVLNVLDIKPVIKLHATESADFEQSYDGLQFENTYTTWQQLNAGDEWAVTQLMRKAYATMTASVMAAGRYRGMVLARCGVRLHDDTYLWLGAPVLVGADESERKWTEAIAVENSGGISGIDEFRVTMPSYRLGITPVVAFGEQFDSMVKSVDVLVSEDSMRYDPSQQADYRCVIATDGVRVRKLQFAPQAISATTSAAALLNNKKWRVATSTSNFAALREGKWDASNVNRSAQPCIGACETSSVQFSAPCGAFVDLVGNGKAKVVNAAKMGLKCVAASAGAVVGRGVTVNHDLPWSIADYLAGNMVKQSGVALVKVRLVTADGEKDVVQWENVPITADALNAVVAYPDSRATHISIDVQGQGNVMRWESDLLPADGNVAVAVDAKVQNFVLTDTGEPFIDLPQTKVFEESLDGSVYIGKKGNAFVGEVRDVLGSESIRWVSMALKPLSSSSFGRYPLIMFADDGVYALPQTPQGTYGEVRLVSRTRVSAQVSPCECGEVVYFLSAKGSLMMLKGAVVVRAMSKCRAVEMVWNDVEGELVMRNADGLLTVLMSSGRSYVRSEVASQLYSHGGHALVAMGGRVCDLHRESDVGMADVEWLSHPIMINRVLRAGKKVVSWNIKGENRALALQVCGERGYSDCGFRIASVEINGDLTAPLDVRMYAPNLRALRLSVLGQMSRKGLLLPVVME